MSMTQVEQEAAILAERQPYGFSINRVNSTKAHFGPYTARRQRSGGPWVLQVSDWRNARKGAPTKMAILTSESLKVLFYHLIKVLDHAPWSCNPLPTYAAALPTHSGGRGGATDCDDPELDSYGWNRSRCRYREHELEQLI